MACTAALSMRVALSLAPVVASLVVLAACSSEGEGARSLDTSQALGGGAPAAVRVVGTPEAVGPQHIGISGPSPCPASGPANAGTNENRFWVPDGPPHAYVGPSGETRLVVPHLRTFPFVGASLNDVALDCSDMISDSTQSADPSAFDDDSWPQAPYRLPDGRTFAINHHEYHPPAHGQASVGTWFAALTLSVAADGVHFARVAGEHTIARPPTGPFANDGGRHGYSDPTNVMRSPADGFYYLVSLRDDPTTRDCVLRTADLADPGGWRAWDGTAYASPTASGGDCVDFTTAHGAFSPGSLTWADSLGTAVYVAFGVDSAGRQGIFAFFDASPAHDLSAWTAPILVLEAAVPWGENPSTAQRAAWAYPSLVDPAAYPNYDHVGNNPYLYFVTGAGDRDLMRVPVAFVAGSAEIRNRGQGLYRVGGGAYYSNGFNQYCAITSPAQLVAMGFTAPFENLMPYADHGALAYAGVCGAPSSSGPLAAGFFTVGASGYFANGAGHSCAVDSTAQWNAMGAPPFASAPSYGTFPAGEQLDGDCRLPKGFFFYAGAGCYANEGGHYCRYGSWDAFAAAGGSTSAPTYPAMPGTEVDDGVCVQSGSGSSGGGGSGSGGSSSAAPPLPAGFVLVSGAGYYANGAGHLCFVSSWPQWVAMGGPASASGAPQYATMPAGQIVDPPCILPAGLFFDQGAGYYANALGHYCGFTSWDAWIAAGGPANTGAVPDYSPIPTSEVFDGACR